METNIAVFVGPSLPNAQKYLSNHIDIVFNGPAIRGDLTKAANDGFKTILLIDGVFGTALAVDNFEIRTVLDCGVSLYGCSSMGVLRAVDTEELGMQGFGWVFSHFKNSVITYEDDLALLYDEREFTNITIPNINLIYTLKEYESDIEKIRMISKYSRKLSWKYRTQHLLRELLANYYSKSKATEIVEFCVVNGNIKKIDAINTINAMKAMENGKD